MKFNPKESTKPVLFCFEKAKILGNNKGLLWIGEKILVQCMLELELKPYYGLCSFAFALFISL